MNIKVIIPAREGSKGLPGKNLKNLCGKPLIDYTILKALEIFDAKSIILTSDSQNILKRGEEFGIRTILRPKDLATDNSQVIDAILHAANFSLEKFHMELESIILLQPTFPIRNKLELKKALTYFKENNLSSLVSVCEMKEHPSDCISIFNNNYEDWKFLIDPIGNTNRQNYSGKHFFINGNFYIAKMEFLKTKKSFLFRGTKFFETNDNLSVDIDDIDDFKYAEYCISKISS